MDKLDFFKKYNIDDEEFKKTRLSWDELMKIYDDYGQMEKELESAANLVAECLRRLDKVHSIKLRIKEPEHLIEKIIRKKIKNPLMNITKDNYSTVITDLIGVRALHLFKEDWKEIHDYIIKTWDLSEKPKANVREGDAENLINKFTENSCDIVNHPYGYRSVHYLIKVKPFKKTYIGEIQVRTIFEEGWCEIDHKVRYPYDLNNPILANYLVVFNRLSGSADEMGSFVNFLCDELKKIDNVHTNELEEKNRMIEELKATINELKIESNEKEKLQNKIISLEEKLSLPDNLSLSPIKNYLELSKTASNIIRNAGKTPNHLNYNIRTGENS